MVVIRPIVRSELAAVAAARARGLAHLLSDVDTDNAPVLAAMRRAGHDPDARPWHVWHHRLWIA